MRDDVLDAKACIDWTVSQLPSLEKRINEWLQLNLYVGIKDPDPNVPNNLIVALQKEQLPRSFNVEVGSHINTIRSSLDILATALAYRYGMPKPDKAYFPIAKSLAEFITYNGFKGAEFIKALPAAERAIIESLNPYKGGNALLWALHQLDIMRKHRKLLAVTTNPRHCRISGWGVSQYFIPVSTGLMVVSDRETVLGLLAKGAPQYDMHISGYVAINETDLSIHKPVIAALHEFASLAGSIINLFDAPR
jgi:hypothetical protein